MSYFPAFLCSVALAASAMAHDFTLPNGGKLTGDITSVANGVITIKTATQGDVRTTLERLSIPDQEHFHQWAKANGKYAFTFAAQEKKIGGQKSDKELSNGQGQGLEGFTQDWAYQVTLRNASFFPVSGATAEVQAWVDLAGPGDAKAGPSATVSLPALKVQSTHQFDSPTVELATFRPPDGAKFVNGNGRMHKHRLKGYTVKVSVRGSTVWVHESHAGLLTMGNGSGLTITGTKPYSGPPEGYGKAALGSGNAKIQFSVPVKP